MNKSESKLPKVIFLLDDEDNKYYLTKMSGLSVHQDNSWMYLCRQVSNAELNGMKKVKLFSFTKMSLLVEDKKMDDYIKTNDGVIIFISDEKLKIHHKKILSRLEQLSKSVDKNVPIYVYVFGKSALFDISKSLGDTPFRKVYHYQQFDLLPPQNNQILEFSKLLKWSNDDSQSRTLPDEDLLQMFENQTLPINSWDHYGRLRVVYLSIKKRGFLDTIKQDGWLCSSWRKYKKSIGHEKLWNYTLTRFWASIIYLIDEKNEYSGFNHFYEANTKLHSGSLFKQYYGDEIFSDKAKINWLPPTKQKITTILD